MNQQASLQDGNALSDLQDVDNESTGFNQQEIIHFLDDLRSTSQHITPYRATINVVSLDGEDVD